MSMDIKINYGTLDAIVDELSGYLTNIDKMRSALTNLNILIERSEGDSIDALWESYTTTLDKLSIFEERISDLRTLIYDYTEAMTREIQPLRRGDDTRADSYDTYWSLMLLNPYLPRFNYVQIAAYDTQGTNETQQAQYQANLNKLDALSTTLKRNVEGAKERLWELHEKVARYEQTDNEFCSRAQQLYVQLWLTDIGTDGLSLLIDWGVFLMALKWGLPIL